MKTLPLMQQPIRVIALALLCSVISLIVHSCRSVAPDLKKFGWTTAIYGAQKSALVLERLTLFTHIFCGKN